MQRTPSPPRRLHTPPAPLHGPDHDSYEPYSPRRSTRLSRAAAQRSQQSTSPTRSRSSRTARETTPTGPRTKGARASPQALSPPTSPISPAKHKTPRSSRPAHFGHESEDLDQHLAAPTPARRFLSSAEPRAMLPTPAKTPRKRVIETEESLSSTARVLFAASNQAGVDDTLPTPSRRRKKYENVFSLESFERAHQQEELQFYVDSRDRVPTGGDDDDNPFLTKNSKSKGKGKAKLSSRKVDPDADKMQAAADRDEGIVYIFRGKKVFRKFQDRPTDESAGAQTFSDEEVRRQAGSVAHRPITRSSVKPRLLFQEEIKERELARQKEEEEAITDIEVPMPTPSGRKSRRISHNGDAHAEEHRKTTTTTTRITRQISFDSWSRVKSATARESRSSRESKKRAGEPLAGASAEKRQKSESASATSMD